MTLALSQRVVLTQDLTTEGLRAGDVGVIIEQHLASADSSASGNSRVPFEPSPYKQRAVQAGVADWLPIGGHADEVLTCEAAVRLGAAATGWQVQVAERQNVRPFRLKGPPPHRRGALREIV